MPHRLRIAGLPAHWLFLPPLAFAALNNIALKSETADAPLFKLATEEVSSVAVIFALVPFLIGMARRWPPAPRAPILLRHLGGSLLFSALHVLGMLTIRHVVFTAAGTEYRPCPLPEMFLYEYGKDVAAYALIIATIGWFDRRFPPAAPATSPPVASFEVKTARGPVVVPAEEILRVEAAGNYATLVTAHGAFLHRATMREIEAALPPARFARTHRSHIVRLDAIAAIRGTNGDREITLSSGDAVPLSRRYAQARDWRVDIHRGSANATT